MAERHASGAALLAIALLAWAAAAPLPARADAASAAASTASQASAPAADAASVQYAPPVAVPTAADPVLEAHMLAITGELRCLVCQNQTIADSHADLAVDLREEVRELIRQGRSDDQIRRYMTDRYGDFVLYRPPFKPTTAVLWLGPAALLAIAAIALLMSIARRARLPDDRFEPDPGWDDMPGNDTDAPCAASSSTDTPDRPGAPA